MTVDKTTAPVAAPAGPIRVALAHLALAAGPVERNLDRLATAVGVAAEAGADWVITPEMAVQGYFCLEDCGGEGLRPDVALAPLTGLAARHGLTLFLGCAERDAGTGALHNSCVVFGPDGRPLGRHRKTRRIGQAESWATPGEAIDPVASPAGPVGILVCADSWWTDNTVALAGKGATAIVVPAAWPPGNHGPDGCWERGSQLGRVPLFVCNQTGYHPRLDFREAVSMVAIDGASRMDHSGAEAVLLFDWSPATGEIFGTAFDQRFV